MKFTDLPVITSSTITSNHVFAVATTSTTDQLTLSELQKCFTSFTAPSSSSINIIGGTTPSGITIGANGYLGVNNTSPTVAVDIGDQGSTTLAEVRLKSRASSRQASYTLTDNSIWWRNTKKASDTDYYIEKSTDGSSFTTVFNIDTNGNVGVHDGSVGLNDKLFVNGGTIKFQNSNSGILFDPAVCEIKNSTIGDILYINKSTDDDIVLGNDVMYIENGANPYVGINTTSPLAALHVKDSGHFVRFQNTSTNTSNLSLSNSSTTSYVSLIGNNFQIGPYNFNSESNLIYDISNERLGIGTNSLQSKLHVKSSDQTMVIFEGGALSSHEVLETNNNTAAAPTSCLYTFASGSASSPTKRWSMGLYNISPYSDSFVLLLDGSTSTSAVKASISRNGDLDIKGSLTTDSKYTKGKFVQIYQTRVTGDCIYFNPFAPDSNTNPSGHNDYHAPFGITSYAGSIEKVQIITSDIYSDSLNPRLEVVQVQPSYNSTTPDGYVSGFFVSPASNPTTFPTSGIIGFASLGTIYPNQLKTYTRSQFDGDTAFASGRLLQYRIAESNGTKTLPIDYTVISTIAYTIT